MAQRRLSFFGVLKLLLLAVGHAFAQFYSRLQLSLYVRGIKLPGHDRVLKKQSAEMQAAISRRALIWHVRGERYSVRKGPIWIRKILQRALEFVQRNRIWASIFVKVTIACLLVVLPSGFFVLLRGMLPVPERVTERPAQIRFNAKSNMRTEWLYSEGPFEQEMSYPSAIANVLPNGTTRDISIQKVLEPDAPQGLFHFGIGSYPRRIELLRGFLASENAPLRIRRQRTSRIDIAGRNRLRLKYHLLSKKPGTSWCRIQIRDNEDKLLLSSEHITPQAKQDASLFRTLFEARFMPGSLPSSYELKSFTFETDTPPAELRVQISVIGEDEGNTKTVRPAPLVEKIQTARGDVQLRDVSQEQCVFALGDLSFESERVKPLPSRGVVFVVVDTLRNDTARDPELMPVFNQFANTKAVVFENHNSQSNMTVPSISALMHSRYPRELGGVSFLYAFPEHVRKQYYERHLPTLAEVARAEGYRAAAMGNVSLFTEALEGGIDFGFHDAVVLESPQYETRHVTEEALDWLEENAEVPFMLYLHYHTLHGPYRPAFEYTDVLKFLASPLGIDGQVALYNGLARYWDNEFRLLLDKLSGLGLLDATDVFITADHGAQMKMLPFGNFSGIDSDLMAANADKGHTLTDEEVHVPFVVKLRDQQLAGSHVKTVSAHIDVLPTLFGLFSSALDRPPEWRGIDLFQSRERLSAEKIEERLADRNILFYDAHRYTGALLYGPQFVPPLKYVRQLEPDAAVVHRSKWPRRARETWYEPESFYLEDLVHGSETWLPTLQGKKLEDVRQQYFANARSPVAIQFRFYNADRVLFQLQTKEPLIVEQLPEGLKVESHTSQEKTTTTVFSGTVKDGETLIIRQPPRDVNALTALIPLHFVACPTAVEFEPQFLVGALKSTQCAAFAPEEGVISRNYAHDEPVAAVWKSLLWETAAKVEITGAGAALRKALQDWGYAK